MDPPADHGDGRERRPFSSPTTRRRGEAAVASNRYIALLFVLLLICIVSSLPIVYFELNSTKIDQQIRDEPAIFLTENSKATSKHTATNILAMESSIIEAPPPNPSSHRVAVTIHNAASVEAQNEEKMNTTGFGPGQFCAHCEWSKDATCSSRLNYLMTTYNMNATAAKASLMEICDTPQNRDPSMNIINMRETPASFSVDILSVASINQLDKLQAQLNTIASHTSVRNFFNATELDDADPTCYKDITFDHVKGVSNFCRIKSRGLSPIFRYLRGNYARPQWLQKKKNQIGWLCAQVRPFSGLMKAQLHYEQSGQALPDFFLIFDDDTYYNMELFQKNFASADSSEARVYAGCLVRSPIHMTNFTFPFGGFGSILSKGALIHLFERNQCPGLDNTATNNNNKEEDSSAFCSRLKENNVGELKYFTNGMSLVELMYKYSSTDKYRDVHKWTSSSGFCMHSDWVLGYFVNYYNVSIHVSDPYYRDVPHARLESYKGSEIYKRGTGFCRNDEKCEPDTEICHRATPAWMEMETKRWKLMAPDKFKDPG